jgi:hypothetical protein
LSVHLQAQTWNQITKSYSPSFALNLLVETYGFTVAMEGNYAIVGAYKCDSYKGAAYVLYFNGSNWTNLGRLTATDRTSDDYFGRSVSISGDNIVIGAYQDDDNGTNSGSVYVFTKPATGWTDMTQTAKIKPSDGAAYDSFGLYI